MHWAPNGINLFSQLAFFWYVSTLLGPFFTKLTGEQLRGAQRAVKPKSVSLQTSVVLVRAIQALIVGEFIVM